MTSSTSTLRGVAVLGLLAISLPSHAFLDKIIGSGGTKTESTNKPAASDYKGVKHAVGVSDFTNEAGWSGRWEIGNNLGIMLESALYDSGRFVVVSREKLGAVIQEQDLAASGRAAKSNVAQTGKLRSARYIATGAITTVNEGSSGSAGGINVKGFTIGGGGSKATITAIIQLIDTTTGEIIAKERVTGKSGGRALRLGYQGSGFGTQVSGFAKEPLGEAAQDVISAAVDFLVANMKDIKLEGSVVTVSGSKVVINRGADFGIEPGQTFVVREQGEELIDPDSGEVLDRMEGEIICTLKVESVRDKIATCTVLDGDKPERGAVVVMQ